MVVLLRSMYNYCRSVQEESVFFVDMKVNDDSILTLNQED